MNNKLFKSTGLRTVEELINEVDSLQEDFLLDETDEDDYTIPLFQQLRSRLNELEEYKERYGDL